LKVIAVLESRKEDVLDRWFQVVADSYPDETTRFLGTKNSRFANPVGHAIRQGLDGILTSLIAGASDDEIVSHLDEIVRIRAIQNFSPSEALAFVFELKPIVKDVQVRKGESTGLDGLDETVERLVKLAMDNYMACRQTLFEIRIKELKDTVEIQSRNIWKDSAGQNGKNVLRGKDTLGGAKMKRGDDQ
jgi:hypothetical protein